MSARCPKCGYWFVNPSSTRRAAEEARALILRLGKRYGSIARAAEAVADRHGRNPATVKRQFARLLAGQKSLHKEALLDELEVLL